MEIYFVPSNIFFSQNTNKKKLIIYDQAQKSFS